MDQWRPWQWSFKAVITLAVAVVIAIDLGFAIGGAFLVADGAYVYWRYQRDKADRANDIERKKSSWSEPLR